MSEDDILQERRRMVRTAMEVMERRAEEVDRSKLASELGISRTRVEAVFPDEADLAEAITGEWFAPLIAVMDEVVASDLPSPRKMFEFFARRFVLLRGQFKDDPATFNFYVELGERYFDYARSYIDLADHLLCEVIVEAQADGYFEGLGINEALSLINQTVICYIQPYLIAMLQDRLTEDKLARIIDTLLAGLSAKQGGAKGVTGLRAAS